MILFWILIAFGLVFLVKESTEGGGTNEATRSGRNGGEALNILDERFAEGEIDEEEYRRRKKELST